MRWSPTFSRLKRSESAAFSRRNPRYRVSSRRSWRSSIPVWRYLIPPVSGEPATQSVVAARPRRSSRIPESSSSSAASPGSSFAHRTASCRRSTPSARTSNARCNIRPTPRRSGAPATTDSTTFRQRGLRAASPTTGTARCESARRTTSSCPASRGAADVADRRLGGRAAGSLRYPAFHRGKGRADPHPEDLVLPRRDDAIPVHGAGRQRHPAAAVLPAQRRRSLRERPVHRHAGASSAG